MAEYEEFAEALIDQLGVEINEEKENSELASKIDEDPSFKFNFDSLESVTEKSFPEMKQKIYEFTGIEVPSDMQIEFPELSELKKLKGSQVSGMIFRS